MKKNFMILGLLCLGLTLSAQTGVFSTRPANPQDGRILTMEETILSRDLSPASLYCTWDSNGSLLVHKDRKWQVHDLKTGAEQEYTPAGTSETTAYVRAFGFAAMTATRP